MPYLASLNISGQNNISDISLEFTEKKHIIFTGPNGSGKSTILRLINSEIENLRSNARQLNPGVVFGGSPIQRRGKPTQSILAYFDAFREPKFHKPAGPKNINQQTANLNTARSFGDQLLQVLVNQYTQKAYAQVDNDIQAVSDIQHWFDKIRSALAVIFEDEDLKLVFHRKSFEYELLLSDNRLLKFQSIADGHKSALAILSELLIRKQMMLDESGVVEPNGIVLIDEIETHLHLRLQEVILPFLTSLFPSLQFIVATHSPAVLASIPDAVVYDFKTKQVQDTSSLQGIEYGTLMTSHFGISSEYDLETTRKLNQLKCLYINKNRTLTESAALQSLANELAQKSHTLAMHILLDLNSNIGND